MSQLGLSPHPVKPSPESSELLQCGVGGPKVSGGCQGSQNSPAEHSSLARDPHLPYFRMAELKLSPGTAASVTPSPVTPAVGPVFLLCVMTCWVTSGGALPLRPHAHSSPLPALLTDWVSGPLAMSSGLRLSPVAFIRGCRQRRVTVRSGLHSRYSALPHLSTGAHSTCPNHPAYQRAFEKAACAVTGQGQQGKRGSHASCGTVDLLPQGPFQSCTAQAAHLSLTLLSEAFQTWVLWSVVTGELSGNQGGQGNFLVKRGAKSWPEGVCVGG